MKKLTLIVAMLVIASMVLAACGGSETNENKNPGAGTTPGVGTGALVTPVGGALDTTPTVEVGALPTSGAVLETPTADAAAVTPAAGEATAVVGNTTPTAGDTTPTVAGATGNVPVTGVNQCSPNTVQGLLNMKVVDSTGMQIGNVKNVIILRDAKAMSSMGNGKNGNGSAGAQVTPAAGDGTSAKVKPAVGVGNAANNSQFAKPQVAYLVIGLENNKNDVAVPFQAFDFAVMSQGAGSMMNQTTDTTPVAGATPAAGTDLTTPVVGAANDAANGAVGCAITLKNVKADALNSAPAFKSDMDFSAANWDNEFRTFWSGKGMTIPNTGDTNMMGAPVMMGNSFNKIKAVDNNGEELGKVQDFIVDPQTGNFTYAVLAAGGFLGIGEKYIPVPMNLMQWTSKDAKDDGQVVLNINKNDWKNAPSFDTAGAINSTVQGWDTDLRTFWDNLKGSLK